MQPTPQDSGLDLALVQLPGHMRRALRTFRKITGLTAVTRLATSIPDSGGQPELSPPVHPRCASRLRSVQGAPCRKQWLIQTRWGLRPADAIDHTCPIGLRCSCVPIRFDNRLVGVAQLVVDSETSDQAFSAATHVLELVVSWTSDHSLVSVLAEEVGALRRCVSELQQIRSKGEQPKDEALPTAAAACAERTTTRDCPLVKRALVYLRGHYQEPGVSLPVVARTLGCNPTYLTSRFTQIVGERMHRHVVGLRVTHACRLLKGTDLPIKEVACVSGFPGPAPLARAFRRHVGVSPSRYRRIFAAH